MYFKMKKILEIFPNLYKSDIRKKKENMESILRGESEKGLSVYK